MIQGYDQWKTASPYDDNPDWAEMGAVCPKCGNDILEDREVKEERVLLECQDCGHTWWFDTDKGIEAMTDKQRQKLNDLENKLLSFERYRKYISLDDFFESLPESDFSFEDSEAGDWHVYCCGDKDCPVQWHKVSYALDIGRENGNRWVEIRIVDEDGDWDLTDAFYESENDDWAELGSLLANHMDEYFYGWAEYWIEAARTGKDPCNQALKTPDNWVTFCLEGVEDNIKYLFMGGTTNE